jgi:hypothetical protein
MILAIFGGLVGGGTLGFGYHLLMKAMGSG